jgi:hypothetical protein
MTILAWLFIILFVAILSVFIANYFKVSLNVFFLLMGLVSSMFLSDFDLGPFSLRVYILVFLFGLSLLQIASKRMQATQLKVGKNILLFYGIYVFWWLISSFATNASSAWIFNYFISRHLAAIIVFLLILIILRTRRDVEFVASGLGVAVIISSLAAILQWQNIGWVWDMWKALYPNVIEKYGALAGTRFFLTPGLADYAFTQGYYMASLGPLLLIFFQNKRRIWIGFLGLLVVIVAVFTVQQRAALLGVIVELILLFIFILKYKRYSFVSTVMFFSIVFIGIFFIVNSTNLLSYGEGNVAYRLDRFSLITDASRLGYLRITFEFIKGRWLFGDAYHYLEYLQTTNIPDKQSTAHNMFLNSLIFAGLPGLLFVGLLTINLFRRGWIAWQIALCKGDYLLLGIILSLLGYLIVAQFHNSSFVTGDTLPWLGIGLLEVRMQQAEK